MSKEQYEEDILIEKGIEKNIVLYNDDINTFDWVIDSLIDVCDHEPLQAEQCAWIVHTKGKCLVKRGSFDYLNKYISALSERGLSAEIE